MNWHLDRLLKLPNMTVVKVQEIEGLIFLSLESLKEGIICPHCGNYTEDVHQTREVLVRDLSICSRGVYLKVPRRQFICSECGRYTTEGLEEMVFKRHHTERYEEYVYGRVVATTVKQVSREEQLKEDEIQAIFEAVSEEKNQKNWQPVKHIGLDEISTAKGQKNTEQW
jgi:transposase